MIKLCRAEKTFIADLLNGKRIGLRFFRLVEYTITNFIFIHDFITQFTLYTRSSIVTTKIKRKNTRNRALSKQRQNKRYHEGRGSDALDPTEF